MVKRGGTDSWKALITIGVILGFGLLIVWWTAFSGDGEGEYSHSWFFKGKKTREQFRAAETIKVLQWALKLIPDDHGNNLTLTQLNSIGDTPHKWLVNPPLYDKTSGKITISLVNNADASEDSIHIKPTMAVNFDITISSTALGAEYGIRETSLEGGVFDKFKDSREMSEYYRPPEPIPLYNGENQGLMLEKF